MKTRLSLLPPAQGFCTCQHQASAHYGPSWRGPCSSGCGCLGFMPSVDMLD